MSTQQEFIQQLVQQETKMSLEEFFKGIHERFYPAQDIYFMNYFLELTKHEGEFIVHHNKLVEYGVMSSKQSWAVKTKLDALELVEDEEYHLQDILEMVRPQGGGKATKVYMLTPEAFKTCLMRSRKYPGQTVDPAVYSKYYLLLEKTYKLYTDYEKELLNKQLQQKDQTIEQKDKVIEQNINLITKQAKEIEEQHQYTLELKEGLLGNIPELEKTQIIYIATSHNYARRNLFKIGGTEHQDKLVPRLATYNTGRAAGDDYFYVNIYHVNDYREIESRMKKLLGSFRDRKEKEMYRLCYNNIVHVLNYIVEHFNDEIDEVNKTLEQFINNLNNRDPAVNVTPLILAQIYQSGNPDVVLVASNHQSLLDKMTEYVDKLDKNVKIVKAKQVFDTIGLKEGRRSQYIILERIVNSLLPNAKMVKF